MTGKALWFEAPRHAALREETLPDLAADDCLIDATVSLVSAGTEMVIYRGEVATADEVAHPMAAGQFPFPIKYGYQVIGRVEEAGRGSAYRPGDRLFVSHPHQERFVLPGRSLEDSGEHLPLVFPLPEWLDDDRAAFSSLFSVAYNAVLEVPVRIGECAVVSGLGVIGTFVAHLARRTASKLLLIDPLPERRDRVGWIGADAVVHPDETPAALEELTEGRGADVWFEASGAPSALQAGIDGTATEGTVVTLGYHGVNEVTLRLSPAFVFRLPRIVPSMVITIPASLRARWDFHRRMAVAMSELRSIDVSRIVTDRVPFERAPEAYRLIDERPESVLGVLLDYA